MAAPSAQIFNPTYLRSSLLRRPSLALMLSALLLAGCSTPKEARTPGPEIAATGAQSRLVERPAATAPASATLLPAQIVSPAQLPPDLAQAWRKTQLPDSALSLVIMSPGEAPWMAINAQEPRNPASLMKLVTTYAALEGLGAGYRWQTRFGTAKGTAVDAHGRLQGPLYIQASGDPSLMPQDLWRVLRELRHRGIQELPGIVIDRTVYGNVEIDPDAFDNAGDRVYNASPDAFLVGYGATRLRYWPGDKQWQVVLDPPLAGIKLDNRLQSRSGNCGGQRPVRLTRDDTGSQPVLKIEGAVPASCGSFEQYRLLAPVKEHSARVLQGIWEELGGRLSGPITEGRIPANFEVMAVHESDTLSALIRPVNKSSNNVMARHLLLTLGQTRNNGPTNVDQGRAALLDVLRQQGLEFPELRMANGAGLSRDARIAPASLARLLESAWFSARMPEFQASMAIAGTDGTVQRRWANSPGNGQAHLKTGTLRDVTGLAGYVQGSSGRRYILVAMVNHPQAYNARSFLDATVDWLARQ